MVGKKIMQDLFNQDYRQLNIWSLFQNAMKISTFYLLQFAVNK